MALNRNTTAATPFRPAAANPANRQGSSKDRAPTMIWLNVGYKHVDETTGEEIFVSLPMGLPIDTMQEANVRGKNEDYVQLQQAKNALLTQLLQAAAELAEGETLDVDLDLQLRRVESAPSQQATPDNRFIAAMANRSLKRAS